MSKHKSVKWSAGISMHKGELHLAVVEVENTDKIIAICGLAGDDYEGKRISKALLIAAAPELLEIAVRLVNEGISTSLVVEARAAIAKATNG